MISEPTNMSVLPIANAITLETSFWWKARSRIFTCPKSTTQSVGSPSSATRTSRVPGCGSLWNTPSTYIIWIHVCSRRSSSFCRSSRGCSSTSGEVIFLPVNQVVQMTFLVVSSSTTAGTTAHSRSAKWPCTMRVKRASCS